MNGVTHAVFTALMIGVMFPFTVLAESCPTGGDLVPTTPTGEFSVLGDGGVVRHERTGLEWQRCRLGMYWSGSSCRGSEARVTWQAALNEARDGWRLPNVNELRSIVERCRRDPAMNTSIFRDWNVHDLLSFWSATPSGDPDLALFVSFGSGNVGGRRKSSVASVRLVREGDLNPCVDCDQGSYAVTTSAGSGGSISPSSRSVLHGEWTTFTVTPNTGHSIWLVSGCNGSLSGNTYTTGPITSACRVDATFSPHLYWVGARADPGGSISPLGQLVPHGSTMTFTVTPDHLWSIGSVTGCNGYMNTPNTYITGTITGECLVHASFR